jgi:hypothetical protein
MTFSIGTPFAKNAGYFWNDDRPSGGLKDEADIRTCPHCQAIIKMQAWRKIEQGSMNGGFCMKCNAPVCAHCNKRMQALGCEPFAKQVEREFEMAPKIRQFLVDAGMVPAKPQQPIITGTN